MPSVAYGRNMKTLWNTYQISTRIITKVRTSTWSTQSILLITGQRLDWLRCRCWLIEKSPWGEKKLRRLEHDDIVPCRGTRMTRRYVIITCSKCGKVGHNNTNYFRRQQEQYVLFEITTYVYAMTRRTSLIEIKNSQRHERSTRWQNNQGGQASQISQPPQKPPQPNLRITRNIFKLKSLIRMLSDSCSICIFSGTLGSRLTLLEGT